MDGAIDSRVRVEIVAFPHRLPRPKTFWKNLPWAFDVESVDNGFHDGAVVRKWPANFSGGRGKAWRDNLPCSLGNLAEILRSAHTEKSSTLTLHSLGDTT